jgi:tetratricopeptide (TPR) repeat protein
MPKPNSPPLEAVLLPDAKPRKSWVPFIMGSILVGSCLMAVVFGIWGLARLMESIDRPGTFVGGQGSGDWQSAGEKQAEYRAVFRLPAPVFQDADVPHVEKFLARYVAAAKYRDQGGLARLVDVNAFLQRMQQHPDMPRLDASSRKALIDELNRNLQLPEDVMDFRLMGFSRLAKGSVVADVILKHAEGHSEPCRIWLQQNERAWSVVDWEVIQQGKTQAAQWAGAQRTALDYLGSMYTSSIEDMNKADDRFSKGDTRGAISLVQSADQRNLPGYVHKEMQLAVATRYHQYRQFQSAIDCLRTIDQPDQVPGVYVIGALCNQALGEGAKAIEAAAHYERLCGFSPDVVRAKALALAQLAKKDEAAAEFKRLLDFDPSDQVALQQLVALLPAGKKGEIADLIARSKDPPETALAVAGNIMILEDAETTQAIKGLLEKNFGSSSATHTFVARIHQHEDEFDLAAAAFRRAHAAEVDEGKKKQRWYEYVSAMQSAGKLVQAYEESPNPEEMFEYLTEGLDAEESVAPMEDLPPLMEAHRRRAPQDPRLFYCTGLLAEHHDDLKAAEEAFAAGEAKVTEDSLKEELQYARLDVLADQGRILDAYRDYENLDGAFRNLAQQCRHQQKLDVLEELIRVRRKSHPKDPEIRYYSIALDIERGKLQQALQSLEARDLNDKVEDQMAHRLLGLKVDVYAKHDAWQSALDMDSEFDEVFPLLAARWEQSEEWDKLGQLLFLQRLDDGGHPQLVLRRMKLAWHLRHEQNWARETLVRSLLRQGKTSAAYAFAEQFQREFQEEFPLLLVRLAQGEPGNVKELYENQRYRLHDIEQDAELLPLLTEPRFAGLRREVPLDLPLGSPRTSLVLFLRQDMPLDEEKLRKLLPGGQEFQVKSLPTSNRLGRTLAVSHEGGRILLTSGDSPYHLLPGDLNLIRSGSTQAKAGGQEITSELKTHKAWLAIEILDSAAELTGAREDRLAKNLVQRLCSENLVAIALDESTTPTTLVPGKLLRAESLTPERPWKEWLSGGSQLWLSLGSYPAAAATKPLGRKAQREFVAAVAKLPAGQFAEVRVDLTRGHATEELWLKVAHSERYDYGGYHLTCELQADSQLAPSWKAGDRCNVAFWQVRETKLPAKE